MAQLSALIEEGIRFPGFAFVNVQSPCVTYGEVDAQLKAQKQKMQPLASLGHDASDRIKAMDLAQHYGRDLYTGVFYRDPEPPPAYGAYVAERQAAFGPRPERTKVLDLFKPAE
jgi:2-oxoglutarate ferredoxin oxidoreductase subunit beta